MTASSDQRIAIIGAGIAGLAAAYALDRHHKLTIYEAGEHIGGHVHTHMIDDAEGAIAVDSGFIVCNDRNYPNFFRMLDDLGVARQPTTMSFAVSDQRTGLEYNGSGLNRLFAQRRNLISPRFYGMLADVLRFHRTAETAAEQASEGLTLGDYLSSERFGEPFIEQYIIPMGAAVWSSVPDQILAFPLRFFVRFFANHGMMQLGNRPNWFTIAGGSQTYVEALVRRLRATLHVSCPVLGVSRDDSSVTVTSAAGVAQFDHVIFACHTDQALHLLQDPSPEERDILGAIPYQSNEMVLHTDEHMLPARQRAWGAWNYTIPEASQESIAVTYNMNMLQRLPSSATYCVSLNANGAINEALVKARATYAHPVFSTAAVRAQQRWSEISGCRRTHYCGAYWRYGFHEDGMWSGLRVARSLGEEVTLL